LVIVGLIVEEYSGEGTFMEPEPVGRFLTEAKIENLKDLCAVEQGLRSRDDARSVTVTDALVDTGAALLSIPTALIKRRGLAKVPPKWVRSSFGVSEASLYEAVRLTIGGRN
jgi:Aspartyl protease